MSFVPHGMACRAEDIFPRYYSGRDDEVLLPEVRGREEPFLRTALDARHVVPLYSTHDLCPHLTLKTVIERKLGDSKYLFLRKDRLL